MLDADLTGTLAIMSGILQSIGEDAGRTSSPPRGTAQAHCALS
jgi:hypothetical protein